jgi:hypothetical protein
MSGEDERDPFDPFASPDLFSGDTEDVPRWAQFGADGSLADEIVLYLLEDCRVVNAEINAPFHLASLGAHVGNVRNKIRPEDISKLPLAQGPDGAPDDEQGVDPTAVIFPQGGHHFYLRGRIPLDLRLHLLTVAPPGGGKSMYFDYFGDDAVGFLRGDVPPIPVIRPSRLTSAGLVGSKVATPKGGILETPGDAKLFKAGIFMFDEMSGLLRSRSDYDADLLDTLLMLLDRGEVHKRTGLGEISFQTYITFWGGTQPSTSEDRINLSYGMGRRFLTIKNVLTNDTLRATAAAGQASQGQTPSDTVLSAIRRGIRDLWDRCRIEEIGFTRNYTDFTRELRLSPIDNEWCDRLAIGWNIVTNYDGEDRLLVDLDAHLPGMVRQALTWKYGNLIYGHRIDVLRLLADGKDYTDQEIRFLLARALGFTYGEIESVVTDLIERNFLETNGGKRDGALLYHLSKSAEGVRAVLEFDAERLSVRVG